MATSGETLSLCSSCVLHNEKQSNQFDASVRGWDEFGMISSKAQAPWTNSEDPVGMPALLWTRGSSCVDFGWTHIALLALLLAGMLRRAVRTVRYSNTVRHGEAGQSKTDRLAPTEGEIW